MPNHCTNRVTVEGPQEVIDWMKAAVREEKEDGTVEPFSANKVIPMPAVLVGTVKSSKPNPEEQAKNDAALKACGYDNWYDWCCQNWGTKWGHYDFWSEEWDGNVIGFSTAWIPSTPVVAALAQKFPQLKITHDYSDEGYDFAGRTVYEDGEQTAGIFYEYDTPEWEEFMADLHGDGWLEQWEEQKAEMEAEDAA